MKISSSFRRDFILKFVELLDVYIQIRNLLLHNLPLLIQILNSLLNSVGSALKLAWPILKISNTLPLTSYHFANFIYFCIFNIFNLAFEKFGIDFSSNKIINTLLVCFNFLGKVGDLGFGGGLLFGNWFFVFIYGLLEIIDGLGCCCVYLFEVIDLRLDVGALLLYLYLHFL